ncbi:rhoptry-associated protein 2/3, putative [Plasmodium gallinaceum]|uniref:Rhoptry-associated protein 2/3, putative n=1 Tax=Plasmodium gallinaceum TaxID=5849 RepID=A0A1J1H022_PLAGA|nr:rhoptry-associated protein 2/3, putative [Plasmodium gallinaceum]CRG97793.1 rhoptry-associated protein 2/3, putative [Plasmodium gallinaceum]
MKKLFFLTIIFSFIFQKAIKGQTCIKSLSSFNIRDLTIANFLHAHNEDYEVLGKWIHFFFSHFDNDKDLMKFMSTFDIKSLDLLDRSCIKRALTIYLLHYYSNTIKKMSNDGTYVSYFKNIFEGYSSLTSEFIRVIADRHYINLLDTIIVNKEKTKIRSAIFPLKTFIKASKKGDYSLEENKAKMNFSDANNFKFKFLDNKKLVTSVNEAKAIQDFNLLGMLGVKDLYYNSDITRSVEGVFYVFNKNKRLGLRRRSGKYDIYSKEGNSKVFGNCIKDNHFYHGSVDDLATFFFSNMKMKMVKGHKKFLDDFELALNKKTYKMPKLKGFRFIKQLFSRKNFKNFIKLYANHVSTELAFLTQDFQNLFDITLQCQIKNINRAGTIYYILKYRNAL